MVIFLNLNQLFIFFRIQNLTIVLEILGHSPQTLSFKSIYYLLSSVLFFVNAVLDKEDEERKALCELVFELFGDDFLREVFFDDAVDDAMHAAIA